ncbi:MAG: YdiU family protein [Pseudomonadota bacterium]|nr:YdiU family protein [Pseudomonadota bacterium]
MSSLNISREVKNACYSIVHPSPVAKPKLLAWSDDLAEKFNLTKPHDKSTDIDLLAGNLILPSMKPYAACYGGHQFGHWAGQLGDGRVITLGEILSSRGERWEFQLKGAGPTPYSRNSDGRAVLRSSVREFLCSEAMYYLGGPTTRALSLVSTGERVTRDMFYDGNPREEPGAIVCRMAPSFVRFGNFEIFTARGDVTNLKKLADFIIQNYFSELGLPSEVTYVRWFEEICRRTAILMVHWQKVGFVHGVMNTDNMSILGLTIDYGPYGWLDVYDPDWTPNTTDFKNRRYSFGNQPAVALWNLAQLANSLGPLVTNPEVFSSGLELYETVFNRTYLEMMSQKLGLKQVSADILTDLDRVLRLTEIDTTIFYRNLTDVELHDPSLTSLLSAFYSAEISSEISSQLLLWLKNYCRIVLQDSIEPEARKNIMNKANPKYILRNYLAHEAIESAENGDLAPLDALLKVIRKPYDDSLEFIRFAEKRPEWARTRAGCSALSCSS